MLVQICITLISTMLLVTAAAHSHSQEEQRLWALGNVVACVGVAQGNLPDVPMLIHTVLSYSFIAMGLGLILRGLRRFAHQELETRWIVLIVLISLVLPGYFTYVEPSLSARMCASAFLFGTLNWLCVAALLRCGRWSAVGTAVTGFAAVGISLMVRGVYLLLHPAPAPGVSVPLLDMSLLVVSMSQIVIVFGLLLMVSQRYADKLRHLSAIDPLTGALNRSALENQGRRIAQRTLQAGRSVSLVMIDADHFKAINDTYGHPFGDEVLRHLAHLLQQDMRPLDLMARYGGEEFVLVLDGLTRDDALKVGERLRQRVEQASLTAGAATVRYTISVGVACSDQHGYDLGGLIAVADSAMYSAKHAGRNRVRAG
ncbi:GGDEF domain-containing protein [Oxalobacteraceae bacterium]|nr:GGDEF domain-containing protein [Oxalobacteraceae bacterium]